MENRRATGLPEILNGWTRTAAAAGQMLATPDGRWAIVSASMTAMVAGSVAWLSAGIAPNPHNYRDRRGSALMPYELFLKLTAQNSGGQFATNFHAGKPAPKTQRAVLAPDKTPAQNTDSGGSGAETRTVTLDRGDTPAGALTQAGVSQADANAAILALAKVYDPKAMRPGDTFEISYVASLDRPVAQITYSPPSQTIDDSASDDDGSDAAPLEAAAAPSMGKLLSLDYSPSIGRQISLVRGPDGAFTAHDAQTTLQPRVHRAGGAIGSSLYLAAMHAGIPADIVVKLVRMFSYEVDLQRDLRPGDSFEVLYDYYYTPDGKPAKVGEISYAALKMSGRTIALYRYRPKGDAPDYFDANGRSVKTMLMKTPVDGARITSGFGMRFHPILGYTRMHKGIDFGVPVGTPVMAAGSGVVKQEGRLGGYGNFMLVDHENGYSTAYGHLSRFAPGIHVGSRVRQGQTIAYSGNTGLSTGPHLHYEIRIHGVQVNPATVKVATGQRLTGRDLRDFLTRRLRVDGDLASMPLEARVADSSGELRAMRD